MTNQDSPLYLSRLMLNPRCRQVRSELAHPYEMHRTLMHAFDRYPVKCEKERRKELDVLFRADIDDRSGCVIVYVQATVEPDWSYLDGYHGYLLPCSGQGNPACKDVAPSYQGLSTGRLLSFTLRANPTRNFAVPWAGDKRHRGKREPILREEDQIAWLMRKGQNRENGCPGGFEIPFEQGQMADGEVGQVPHVTVAPEGKLVGRKTDDDGKRHKMTHNAIRCSGLLRITDPDAFRNTIIRGIGPAKAFGFGLLSVAQHIPRPLVTV